MQSVPMGLGSVTASRAREEHGRRGLMRALAGSRHWIDGRAIEIGVGGSGECVCLTCGVRGSQAELEGLHAELEGAHVWAVAEDVRG